LLRIWSWNVNGLDLWDRLHGDVVDIALLQEARRPPAGWPLPIAPDPADEWRTLGWMKGAWSRRTAIVQVTDTYPIRPIPLTTIDRVAPEALPVSRPGTLAAAQVDLGDETITLVSMYGMWERSISGPQIIYADASAHRLISDLAALIPTQRGHSLIAAGDLNILNRYGEHGDPYWKGRYTTVFDRAAAMGLVFVGPQAPNGRQADPRPAELPEGSLDVPTYHTRGQGPLGATRQMDFVFASQAFASRLSVRALNNDPEEWGPSDHCRILIEIQL
jgi:exonuclease III